MNPHQKITQAFRSILALGVSDIHAILRQIKTQDLASVLKYSEQDVRDKIYSTINEKAFGLLKHACEAMPEVPLAALQESVGRVMSCVEPVIKSQSLQPLVLNTLLDLEISDLKKCLNIVDPACLAAVLKAADPWLEKKLEVFLPLERRKILTSSEENPEMDLEAATADFSKALAQGKYKRATDFCQVRRFLTADFQLLRLLKLSKKPCWH